MRFLLTTCPAPGHLFLLVPLGWAMRNAGHDVLVPVPPALGTIGSSTGLPTTSTSDVDMMEVMERTFAPLLRGGIENSISVDRDRYAARAFTELAETVAEDVAAIARDFRPDLVIHDSIEFAGPLAAAVHGIPTAAVGWGTWLSGSVERAIHEELRPLYARYGAEPQAVRPTERIDVCPPSLREPDLPDLTDVRFEPYNGSAVVPRGLLAPVDRQRVCVTVGGSVGSNSAIAPRLLRPVLDGLADLEIETVVALGNLDINELGDLPHNATVQRWLPLNQILPTCDLIIHHAGSGTSMTAARYGVPQIVCPQLADQFRFADQLVANGVAERLDEGRITAESVRAVAIRMLSTDDSTRRAATTLAARMAELPSCGDVVPILERAAAPETVPRPV